jgi:tetratricopeptide (TPR) repeat protein
MHYNNLAIIHQSAGKVHIALHYYVRALSLIEKINQTYSSFADIDGQGFASPVPLAEILHNASLCAAQAGKWESAYECMAKCTLVSPEVFARRARCWLHIAEACIGMHTSKREDEGNDFSFSIYRGDGR